MQIVAIEIEALDGNWHFIDLDENTSVTIKEKSPLFSTDAIPSLASYSATAPASPHNQKVFQNANILSADRRSRWTALNARLYIGGILWRELILKLKKGITRKRLPFVLESKQKFLFDGVNLRDIPWEAFNIGDTTQEIIDHMKLTIFGKYPEYSHAFFTVQNNDIDGEQNAATMNGWKIIEQEFFTNYDSPTYPKARFVCPFFYLFWVIQQGLKLYDFSSSGDFFNDAELATLAFYNNKTLDKLVLDAANNPDDSTNVFSGDIDPKRHLPDMTFSELLVAIQQLFGVAVIFKDDQVIFRFKKNMLNSTIIKDWTHKTAPDYKIDLLPKIEKRCFYEDTNDARWKVVEPRPLDVTDSGTGTYLSSNYLTGDYEGQIFYRTDTMQYVVVRPFYDDPDADPPLPDYYIFRLYSEDLFCTEAIDSDKKTEVNVSPLLGVANNPDLANPLNSMVFEDSEDNEFGPRLTFFRGMNDLLGLGLSPLATFRDSFTLPISGTVLNFNYALDWNGEKGLFNQFLKAWYEATNEAELVEKRPRLNVQDLIDWDWTSKISLYEADVADAHYLPYEYAITLKINCIKTAKVKFAKLC